MTRPALLWGTCWVIASACSGAPSTIPFENDDAGLDAGVDTSADSGTADAGPDDGGVNAGPCLTSTGPGLWTWIGGETVAIRHGAYGTRGVPDPANVPGARRYAASWVDARGAFWLFGGWGYGASGQAGYLNDLWKFDGTNWAWVAGSYATDQLGASDEGGCPGARELAASWVDPSGTLWLFGGLGFAMSGQAGYLNDLWRFDGTSWIWAGGARVTDQLGTFVDGGMPGARTSPAIWVDSSGISLFGGRGYGAGPTVGNLNDLWKFDGSTWTWLGGGTTASDAVSVHGPKGVADAANLPGGLQLSASWKSREGNLWLFGGEQAGLEGPTNDLWKFDGTRWTWVTGSGTITPGEHSLGSYGQQGVADLENSPGARRAAVSWADRCGNLWLTGGYGWGRKPGRANGPGPLNDVWRFNGTSWTWMAGASTVDQPGTYGDAGVGAEGTAPGARSGAAWWVDANGSLWIFGGMGIDSTGAQGELNDLWRYQP